MKIKLNKYNYITSYAFEGEIGDDTIEIFDDFNKKDPFDFQYIKGQLSYNPIPKEKPLGLDLIYNGVEWVEESSLEEQLTHWRNKLIEADRKCREEQELFGVASTESLTLKQKYMDLHMRVSHELALTKNFFINKATSKTLF